MKIYTYLQKMYDMLAGPFFLHFSLLLFNFFCRLWYVSGGDDSRVFGCLLPKHAIVHVSKASHTHTNSNRVTGSSSAIFRNSHVFREKNAGRYCIYLSHLNKWCEIVSCKSKKKLWWNFHLQFWTLTRDVSSFLLHTKKVSILIVIETFYTRILFYV